MTPPRRKKPTLVSEITRTLQTYDILVEELQDRGDGGNLRLPLEAAAALLRIANDIAARTED